MKRAIRVVGCLFLLAVGALLPEARARGGAADTLAATTRPTLTVAVLDFQSTAPGSPELGQQISETIVAMLSGQPGFTLVERASLQRVLQEHELNLSGLVSNDQAIHAGKLIGAKVLVMGKVFALDKQVLITAKIVSTETGLVLDGEVVQGDKTAEVGKMVMEMAERLSRKLPAAGSKLDASNQPALDPLPALKTRLAGRKLPVVAVAVSERHVAAAGGARIDPAVDTELKMLLTNCGFTVIDGDARDWAKGGVEVVISGEAFSEFAARIGNLISCTGRVEVKVTNYKDNKVLLADRDNNRGVDIAENLAAKQALQKSGRLLGIRILQYFADNLPPAK